MIEWVKKNFKKILRIVIFVIFVVVVFREYARFDKIFDKESEYVLNTNSMKIHIDGCVSEKKMSDKNRKTVKAKVLDLVGDGYTICFNCYAGLKRRNVLETVLDNTLFRNITAKKLNNLPSVEEYLKAVDAMCEWYTNHIPTYLTELEQESLSDYEKLTPYIINNKYQGEYLNDYKLYNKYKSNKETNNTYKVITATPTDVKVSSSDKNLTILKANENAVKYYKENYDKINFRKQMAYYPCELISDSEDDYKMAGDDCVRLIFSTLNYMDKGFTNKLKTYSKLKWSRITSNLIAGEKDDVSYALQVLGFKIYDSMGFSKDINGDGIVDLTIDSLLNNFELQKGDIIARPGHVHFYLGDGKALSVENFGWGKVNRCFPQISNIYIENNRIKFVNIITGKAEYYTRVYHYAGTRKE